MGEASSHHLKFTINFNKNIIYIFTLYNSISKGDIYYVDFIFNICLFGWACSTHSI
jgi:hypothetical protein